MQIDITLTWQVLLAGFGVAFLLGAVVNKTNFCTMGAVSDWINMGSTGRLWAWFLAIAIALMGVTILQVLGIIDLNSTRPPYRTANFAWLRYCLGGLLFGVGMTLAGGCANKNLVNLGNGNLKSLLVLIISASMAYLMTQTELYELGFYPWIQATTIDFTTWGYPTQELSVIFTSLTGADNIPILRGLLGALIALTLLIFALRSIAFRANLDNLLGGFVTGAAVVAGWYITAGPLGQSLQEEALWMDQTPVGLGAQSYTFVNPLGETLAYGMSPDNTLLITFGMMAIAGVIVGSLTFAVTTKRFHFVWFRSMGDFIRHLLGGVLIGVGGILAMGCTIGQGITGVSTLAIGSWLALSFMIMGSALTMKILYAWL